MTRPVSFIRPDAMLDDILKLHNDNGIRHFPIVQCPAPKLIGILTFTDLSHAYLSAAVRRDEEDGLSVVA
jgi:CBS domain-containing protein